MPTRRWVVVLFLVALGFSIGACGTKQTLEQAMNCDHFKRLPDGSWSAKDVSLDYVRDGREYQFNINGETIITGKNSSEDALILATLDKKCAANQQKQP